MLSNNDEQVIIKNHSKIIEIVNTPIQNCYSDKKYGLNSKQRTLITLSNNV